MDFSSLIGRAFWLADEDSERSHINIVVSDQSWVGNVLLIHLSSVKNRISDDKSCVLTPDELPIIKVKSFVYYQNPREYDDEALFVKIMRKEIILLNPDVPLTIVERIREGARISRRLPRKFKEYFE